VRKLWCAGAIASGMLLLGGAPAWADEPAAPAAPGPAAASGSSQGPLSTALGYALEPTNGWRLGSPLASDPLSGQPLVQLDPGSGRKVVQLAGGESTPRLEDTKPAKNRNVKRSNGRLVPSADVLRTLPQAGQSPSGPLGGLPVQGVPMPLSGQNLHVANMPVDGLVGRALGGFGGFGGLTPSGVASAPATRTPAPDERPIAAGQRLERAQSEFPLLGGLGGGLPVRALSEDIVDFQSGFSGLPLGGEALRTARSARVTPDDGSSTPAATPTTAAPSASAGVAATSAPAEPSAPAGFSTGEKPKPAGDPAIDDPRLTEEPVDGFVIREKK
jgi:hypothetical protein